MPFANKIISQAETVNSKVVSQIVQTPEYKNMQNGTDISNYLIEKNLYKKYYVINNPTAVMADKQGPYTAILTFEKDGQCDLDAKNCYVLYSVKTSKKFDKILKTYFNDKGLPKTEEVEAETK